jgi:sugar lactone lactonase YvrE
VPYLGVATLLAGSTVAGLIDEKGADARFFAPSGLLLSPDSSTLVVCDTRNNRIREVDLKTGAVRTIAGRGVAATDEGMALAAAINEPRGLVWDAFNPQALYITSKDSLRRLDLACTCLRLAHLS